VWKLKIQKLDDKDLLVFDLNRAGPTADLPNNIAPFGKAR
jgi:hypothetical protein